MGRVEHDGRKLAARANGLECGPVLKVRVHGNSLEWGVSRNKRAPLIRSGSAADKMLYPANRCPFPITVHGRAALVHRTMQSACQRRRFCKTCESPNEAYARKFSMMMNRILLAE